MFVFLILRKSAFVGLQDNVHYLVAAFLKIWQSQEVTNMKWTKESFWFRIFLTLLEQSKCNFGWIRFKLWKYAFVLSKQCFAPWPFQCLFKRQTLSNMMLWSIVNELILTILAYFVNNNDQLNIVIPSFYPFSSTNIPWAKIPLANNLLSLNSHHALSMGTVIRWQGKYICFWFIWNCLGTLSFFFYSCIKSFLLKMIPMVNHYSPRWWF